MSSLTFYPEGGAPRESDGSRAEVKIIGNTYDIALDVAGIAGGTSPIAVTGPLTDAELRASGVTVKGTTPRVTATYTRGADATQYSLGDIIANSTTAASVTPITFSLGGSSGRITGVRAAITAASGTIVFPAFDLLIFRPEASVPFAAGGYPADNAVMNIGSTPYANMVALFSFSATGWRNQAGGTTAAGAVGYQATALSTRSIAPFNVSNLGTSLVAVMQAQNTWNPGSVIYNFAFALDIDLDA